MADGLDFFKDEMEKFEKIINCEKEAHDYMRLKISEQFQKEVDRLKNQMLNLQSEIQKFRQEKDKVIQS